MRVKMIGMQFEVKETNVDSRQSDTILTDTQVISQIEHHFQREIDAVYLLENGSMSPVLLVEWRYYLSEADQYELLTVDFSENELSNLYDMGIL